MNRKLIASIVAAFLILTILWFTGTIANTITPLLDSAQSERECAVVHTQMCHGKRYAINQKYKSLYMATHYQGFQCLLYAGPHDQLEYDTTVENGECELDVDIPENCPGNCTQFARKHYGEVG